MPDARDMHSVLVDMENVHLDLQRLGSAVELVGQIAKIDGIDKLDGGAVEVLGEVIRERVGRLTVLLGEGLVARRGGVHA